MLKHYKKSPDEIHSYLNHYGQGIVEFVLLLTVIMLLSLTFLRTINTGLADNWVEMAKIITEDPNVKLELK